MLSVTTVGDLVLATTESRRLVAYDDEGRFVWEQRLSDVSPTGARALGRDLVVVVTKTGHVEVRHAGDGSVLWSTQLGGAPTGEPAVDESHGRFYVADDSRTVTAFGLDGPAALWTASVGGSRTTLAAIPTGVAVNSGGEVTVLEGGVPRWSATTSGGGPIDVFADVVVVSEASRGSRIRALNVADGKQRWSYPGVLSRTATGDRMVLVADDALIAVDARGVQQARLELPGIKLNSTLHPVPTSRGDGVWLWWNNADRLIIWGPAS